MSNNNNTESPDDSISDLRERVDILEEQVLGCLRYIRFQAEKEVKRLGILSNNPKQPKAKA